MGKNLKGKELGTGLSQLKNGYYAARFTTKYGKRMKKTSQKLQECRKWLADMQYEDDASDLCNAENFSVQALFDMWIDVKSKTVRYNTCRNYNERFNQNIKPVIGRMLIKDVKPIHCQKILIKMADEGYCVSTVRQARIAIYNMFQFAVDNEMLVKNPCNNSIKSNMGKPEKKRGALTKEEQKAFLDATYGSAYDLQFRFILQTGLRTGELVGLEWNDIDFENKTMKIKRTLQYRYSAQKWLEGEPKTAHGIREIPLTSEALHILELQRERNRHIKVIQLEWKNKVFLCRKGTPVKNSTYDVAIQKYCDRSGVEKFSMHTLRHTFATRCIEGGMTPKTLQTILGHSNIGITMNLYVHITQDTKSREISAVEGNLLIV